MASKNSGKEWTKSDLSKLKQLARQNTETPKIAKDLGRSKDEIYSKASEINVSLKPKDK